MRCQSIILQFRSSSKTYALVVDDLDNGGKPASVRVVAVDHNDTANLNEAPGGTLNRGITHFDGILFRRQRRFSKSKRMLRDASECLAGGMSYLLS